MSKKYMQDGLTLDEQLAIAYGAPATGFGNYDDNEIANLALQELIDSIDTKSGGDLAAMAQPSLALETLYLPTQKRALSLFLMRKQDCLACLFLADWETLLM